MHGLPDAAVNELLEFEDGTVGLALNLDEASIGAVVLGDSDRIEEGQTVKATGRILSVPVGDGVLGRVVNASASRSTVRATSSAPQLRRMEIQAPGIMGRKPVHEPLQTGIKSIDSMTPIGRGQRELIIGDRKTGKTTIAVDTILNQKGQGVKCIYVAIGQKGSTVAQTVETLRQNGAMEYTVVVTARRRPGSVQVPRPLRRVCDGAALDGERRARLVVYDDLSKQAEAYRQVSLLLRRPPGREAYPGDVFYLHSRLLERAAKLGRERRRFVDGCLSSRRKAGDISAYIPTNVISITDGQVYFLDSLFKSRGAAGRRRRQLGVASAAPRRSSRCARSPERCSSTWPSSASSRRSPRSAPTRCRVEGPSSTAAPAGRAAQAAAEQPDAA